MGVVIVYMIVDFMNIGSYMYVIFVVIWIFFDFFCICYDMFEGDVIE